MPDTTLAQIAWTFVGVSAEGAVMASSRKFKWSEPTTYIVGGLVAAGCLFIAAQAMDVQWVNWRHHVNLAIMFLGVLIWFGVTCNRIRTVSDEGCRHDAVHRARASTGAPGDWTALGRVATGRVPRSSTERGAARIRGTWLVPKI
jgi:hypothetical protein